VSGGAAVAVAGVATAAGALEGAQPEDRAAAVLTANLAVRQGDSASTSIRNERKEMDKLRSRDLATVSRSDRRTEVDNEKAALLRQKSRSGGQVTRTKDLGSGDPRQVARVLLGQYGFSADQFPCLDALWTKESGWNVHADNPTSSAYGIPQALPGSKMATAGSDWASNAATQIRWGLGYIRASYGTPCSAWAHSQSYNWY